jgi:hypothetical protein
MRKLSVVCLAAALLAGPVLAAPAADVHATAEQLSNVEGTYGLSNGRVLRLYTLDNRLYAELKSSRTELVAVGENAYASKDGTISVKYNPDASRDEIAVTLGVDPAAALARVLPTRGSRALWALR